MNREYRLTKFLKNCLTRYSLFLFLWIQNCPLSFGQSPLPENADLRIEIGILTTEKTTQLLVTPIAEVYTVYADSVFVAFLKNNDVLSVSLKNDSLELKNISRELGKFSRVKVKALSRFASLKIKPADGKNEIHLDNDLSLEAGNKTIRIVNRVDLDNYVAGVVEAETGYAAPDEYYKMQAIMCRTFALENKEKHKSDGYSVCDTEHCQVFKGRNKRKQEIKLAVAATSGIVLVDTSGNLIFAAYHSNCGGQTDFSQNVWKTAKPYLQAVRDTFCMDARNANWVKSITLQEWEKYLVEHKQPLKPAGASYRFIQENRKVYYDLFGAKVAVTQLRKDFELKSAFFNIEQVDERITFTGRGSGHGVGLCQHGAMQMAKQGFDYKQIFGHYYNGVRLVNFLGQE